MAEPPSAETGRLSSFAGPSADCRHSAACVCRCRCFCCASLTRPRPYASSIDATPIASFDNRDPSKVRFRRPGISRRARCSSRNTALLAASPGIHMEPGGNRFIAVTDKGSWLRGRIILPRRQTCRHCRRGNVAGSGLGRKAARRPWLVRHRSPSPNATACFTSG